MTLLVRTADVAAREREELWRFAVSQSFVPLDFHFASRDRVDAELVGQKIGNVIVTEVTAGPHRAERTERHIARSDDASYYKLSLPTSGSVVITQDGRAASLRPGDLALYDTSRPYQVVFDDTCRMIVLMFPHQDLHLQQTAMRDITACRIPGGYGIGGVVSPLLINLADHINEVGEAESLRLADNVVDLLSTLCAGWVGQHSAAATDSMRILLMRIKAFIAQHLDDPELGPDAIAAACYVSTGYLHKLFRAEQTSVSRYIRERRLEQCRRDLLDPERRDIAVSAIGARWGFFDAAHFSRVFKASYGVAPREYRLSRDIAGTVRMAAADDGPPPP